MTYHQRVKLIQDLLALSKIKGKTPIQILTAKLPGTYKAKWFAEVALNTAEQSIQPVFPMALFDLNAFPDSS